jgi:hypothetical protein
MDITTDDLAADIHIAEIDRALGLVAQVWEDTEELSVDEMCEHLDAVNDIVTKSSSFNDFVESTNLSGRERLN